MKKDIAYPLLWANFDPNPGWLESLYLEWRFISQKKKVKSGHYYLIPKSKYEKLVKQLKKKK